MKKNFSVNIGGQVFNIDDDAYERLNAYLSRLHAYFATEPGKDEIISDIEFRISELLEQKRAQGNAIISLAMVNEVIAGIGEPDQLSGMDNGTYAGESGDRTRGKLYRDPDSRLIGGVAAGIAAFFGINPVWIRILFAILTLVYFIGVILYLILWLILPEAKTISERLEMQRRTINLDNLRNEVVTAGSGLKKTGNSVISAIGNLFRFLTEVITHVFRLLFKVLQMASGVFLLGLVIAMFVLLSLAYLVRDTFHTGMYHLDTTTFMNMMTWYIPGPSVRWLAYLGITLLALGLAGMFIYLGLRLLLKWPPLRWQVLSVFGLAILSGLVIAGAAVYQYSRSTQEKASSSRVQVYQNTRKALHITLGPENSNEYWHPLSGSDIARSANQVLGNIDLSIRPAPGDSLIVTTIREATDFRQSLAERFLGNMEYNYTLSDTLAMLNPYFMFPKSDGMHNQTVEVILGIPVKTKVRIDENIRWKLNYHEYLDLPDSLGEYEMTGAGLKALHPPKPDEN